MITGQAVLRRLAGCDCAPESEGRGQHKRGYAQPQAHMWIFLHLTTNKKGTCEQVASERRILSLGPIRNKRSHGQEAKWRALGSGERAAKDIICGLDSAESRGVADVDNYEYG